jgi:hypothetical protein
MFADGDPRLETVGLQEPRRTDPAKSDDHDSQDYIEGPKAFAERRKPNWQNR